MKKLMQLLLTFVLLFNYFTPAMAVFAEDLPISTPTEQESKTEEKMEAKGNLELDIKFVLPIQDTTEPNIGFRLKDAKGNSTDVSFNQIDMSLQKSYSLKDQTVDILIRKLNETANPIDRKATSKVMYYAVTIYGLLKGNYSVELYGDGYKTYTVENISLDAYSKRVSLTNLNGMFEVGDINQDEKVNQSDIDLMISSILAGSTEKKYDLNRDGKVDIADLNYITANIHTESEKAKIENTSLIVDASMITMTGAEGSLSDAFQENGEISVKPKNEGEISKENPAELDFEMKVPMIMEEVRLETGLDSIPEEMDIIVVDENGLTYNYHKSTAESSVHPFTDKGDEKTIKIDLNGQIAVKKITIQITKTSTKELAKISKVEFLNNVYEEIPKPEMEIPTGLKVEVGSELMTITYDQMPNITGYEILVEYTDSKGSSHSTVYQTTYTTMTIEDLDNYTDYHVSIQSVNQEWKSGFSKPVVATPKPSSVPPAPDMVVAEAVYAGFNVRWKDMKDTVTYNLYYREVGTEEYQVVREIDATSYKIRDLKTKTEYELYVTGNNEFGEGPASKSSKVETLVNVPPITPTYKLINTSLGEGVTTAHIKDVEYSDGIMVGASKFAMVDDNHLSYWQKEDWEGGVVYRKTGTPKITLDGLYNINAFAITVPDDYPYNLIAAKIYYWKNGEEFNKDATLRTKLDENGKKYYYITVEGMITADQVQVAVRTLNEKLLQISEIKIYEYDSLEDDVAALFKDDLRIELQEGVTLEKIQELRKRANTVDLISEEYHPNKDIILNDLDYAEKLLNDKAVQDVITVDQTISNSRNGHLGFAMSINDYQPLGIVARPGEKITIYAGAEGRNIDTEVIFTQFYAEANVWKITSVTLQKGQNIIEVPKIGSMATERGGSVYLRYKSSSVGNPVRVRVSGGHKIPMLDLSLLETETEKRAAIKTYVEELDSYVASLPDVYKNEGLTYEPTTSVLNSTEIVTEKGLLSFAASAVNDAIKAKLTTTDEKVNRVYESLYAFDEMVEMFYRQKGLVSRVGLTDDELKAEAKNLEPAARVNIRYMRMFTGAFMYAGGLHIGIEYGSIGGLLQGTRNSDEGTGYFGWGISHEIGHQINQSKLVYAEVTNNVYALLAQTSNDQDKSRLETSDIYPKIYEKVTSNTYGKASNVFVQLGLYWQLHLAYDDEATMTDTDSIYAKINRLTRNSDITADSKEDLLVKYASEAVGKDLSDFFEAWGYVISDDLRTYLSEKYPEKETRKIEYLNDEARRQRLGGMTAIGSEVLVNATMTEADSQSKRVTLNFSVNTDKDKILGYEIIRNGEVIAFTTENTFTDNIGSINNRAFTYEVVAYDYLLNATKPTKLDEVKIAHDGSILKDNFTIESSRSEKGEIIDPENEEMDTTKLAVNKLIDGKQETYFNGTEAIRQVVAGDTVKESTISEKHTTTDKETHPDGAYVILSLNNNMSISGIKYQAAVVNGELLENTVSKYAVYVSQDKENWVLAKSGTFDLNSDNHYTNIVYFDKEGTTGGNQLYTYHDISYVKIVAEGANAISGAELDVIAPPGDNVDFTEETIGVLSNDYYYDTADSKKFIPKGSVVIKGEYRGNPAFNAMLIVDANDDTIVYEGENFLFASLNSNHEVYEIASGYWFYTLTKEQYESMAGKSIRAELYRVNDAETNKGQRLTSTSKAVTNLKPYNQLPKMEIVDSTKGEN